MSQGQITISARNTASLFVSSLVPFIIGNMLLITLPLLAARLGANQTMIGLFMSSTFLAVTGGSVAAGWFAKSQQSGVRLLVACGLANGVILGLIGLTTRFEILVIMTWLSMFLTGFGQTTINILTGQIAAASERGRVFGFIGLTFGLGLLIGGFIGGPIVDRFGFVAFFFASGLFFFVQSLAALNIRVQVPTSQKSVETKAPAVGGKLQGRFYLLFLASLIAFIAQFVGVLGRQLVMDEMGFSVTMISVTLAVSGLCVTPMTFLAGWVSDRINRIFLLNLTYVFTFLGLVVMIGADDIFRFGLSAGLLTSVNAGLVIGLAHITDGLPPASLSRGLSAYNSTVWLGAVIGFAFAGPALQNVGAATTFAIAAILAAISIILVLPVMRMKKREQGFSGAANNPQKVWLSVGTPGTASLIAGREEFNPDAIEVNLVDCAFLSYANSNDSGYTVLNVDTHDKSANRSVMKCAIIRRQRDKVYLEGIAHNTRIRINGLELEPHLLYRLRKGDEIELGPLRVVVLFEESVDGAP